jgi:RHS repeat-associated protein
MDEETGLIYLRARYYDLNIGRFISKDPVTGSLSSTQSLNRYSYVKNNPVNSVDPLGLCSENENSYTYYNGKNKLYTLSEGFKDMSDVYLFLGLEYTKWEILKAAKNRPFGTSLKPYVEGRGLINSASDMLDILTLYEQSFKELERRGITKDFFDTFKNSHENAVFLYQHPSAGAEAIEQGIIGATDVTINTIFEAVPVNQIARNFGMVEVTGQNVRDFFINPIGEAGANALYKLGVY